MTFNKTPQTSLLVSKLMMVLLFSAAITLSGCSSPEEKAKNYYEKGMSLLEEGETEKAKIEFKNALQIKKTMNSAIYGLALAFEKEGDWQKVFNLVSQVVEQDPKNVPALIKLGSLYLATNKVDKALEITKKLDAISPDASEVLSFKAAVTLKGGDNALALDLANKSLAKNPANTEAIVVLASERIAAGDINKAVEYLDQGLAKNPNNVGLSLIKVTALEGANELDKAEKIHQELIKQNPNKSEFKKSLAYFYMKHQQNDKAEVQLREVIKQDTKSFQAKMDLIGLISSVKGPEAARKELDGFVEQNPKDMQLRFAQHSIAMKVNDGKAAEEVLLLIIKEADAKDDRLKAKSYLATKYFSDGKKAEGSKLIDEVLAEDARNEQALLLKAGLDMDDKKYETAIAHLRTILSDSPNSSRALVALAKAHELSGAYELADEHYSKAVQASKMDARYSTQYVEFLLRRKQPERAEKIIEELLTKQPNDVGLLKMLASTKISRGDWAGAQEAAERIRKNGTMPQLADQIIGSIFAGQKNFAESIAAFKRAYDAAPNDAQALNSLIRAYIYSGKSAEAIAFLNSLVKANPKNITAQMYLAQVYTETKDVQSAIQTYLAVIGQTTKVPQAYQALANLYSMMGKPEEAQRYADEGMKQNANNASLKFTQAGLYESAGKFEDAIKIYEELYKSHPDSQILANNLASLLVDHRTDKNDLTRAYEIAQKLAKSDSPYLQDTVGWAAYKVGKYNEAVTALQLATTKMPDVAIFQYHLGKAYLGLLNKSDAKAALQKAQALSKGKSEVPQDEISKLLAEIG